MTGPAATPQTRRPSPFSLLEARGRSADLLLVAVSVVANLGVLIVVVSHGALSAPSWTGILLLLAGPLALFWRTSHPAIVLLTCVAVTWSYVFSDNPAAPIWLPLIIALINAVINGARPLAYGVVVATLLVRLVAVPLPGVSGPPLSETAMLAGWLALLLAIGELVRFRRALAAEKEQRLIMSLEAKVEDVRRESIEQRLKLARDLHDVLGHHLAVINVQAKLGLRVLAHEAAEVRDALDVIQAESRQALQDVQAFLDTLHSRAAAATAPTPTVSDLDSLVSSARAAGLRVDVEVLGVRRQVPAPQDLSASMVITESITNVLRHAGLVPTRVAVDYGSTSLGITVTNPLRPGRVPGDPHGSRGRGIEGMRARVSDHGGTLLAGPSSDGNWIVRARLPIPKETP